MAATRRVDEEYTSIPVGFRRNGNLMADSRFGNYSCGWNLRGSWVKLQKVEQIRFLSMILIRRRCVCQNIIKKKNGVAPMTRTRRRQKDLARLRCIDE